MKRLATLMLGIALLTSTTGCYCMWPLGGFGCGSYQGGNGYWGGGCGVSAPTGPVMAPQQGAYYGPQTSYQAGIPMQVPMSAALPPAVQPYPTTAVLESLPTYR